MAGSFFLRSFGHVTTVTFAARVLISLLFQELVFGSHVASHDGFL